MRLHGVQILIFTLLLKNSFSLKLIAATEDASNKFKSMGKWSSNSKIQCAGYLDTKIKEGNNDDLIAIRYENGFCELGELGSMPGDFEISKNDINSEPSIYLKANLPRTNIIGQNLHFFFSFLTNNKDKSGIVQNEGKFQRVAPTETDGAWGESWPESESYLLDQMPFKTGGINPGFISYPTQMISLTFEIPPVDIRSFSIFSWDMVQHVGQANHGVLAFGRSEDKFDQEVYFVDGLPDSELAQRPCFCTKVIDICSSVLFYLNYWIYNGVVFDSDEGSVTFYLNGVKTESIQNPQLVGNEWTNIQYIIIGRSPKSDGGTAHSPRASVELHLHPMSAVEAANQYQNALSYFEQ